jgi:uncharacterized OB-fold protein
MAEKNDTAEKCPLCGTKFKLPSYKCKNCDRYYTEDRVIKDKSGKARCPSCKMRVSGLSAEDVKKHLKCRECGFRFKEVKGLKEFLKDVPTLPQKEELQILESELETLSDEIGKILGDEEEQKVEEISEGFKCPKCGREVAEEEEICSGCGLDFLELEEIPDNVKAEEVSEERALSKRWRNFSHVQIAMQRLELQPKSVQHVE